MDVRFTVDLQFPGVTDWSGAVTFPGVPLTELAMVMQLVFEALRVHGESPQLHMRTDVQRDRHETGCDEEERKGNGEEHDESTGLSRGSHFPRLVATAT